MTLVIRRIKGGKYYYSSLSYFLVTKSRSFSKYIGRKKPSRKELENIENSFKEELIRKTSGKRYSNMLLTRDEAIKTLLFNELFSNKYQKLNWLKRRKYDIDSTISFTLTTLTTEEVDVDLEDVENAFGKNSQLTKREQISKNMLMAVDSLKESHKLDEKYMLNLHKLIMAGFETKTPGKFRDRQVYLRRKGENSRLQGVDLSYQPPNYKRIRPLLADFFKWYNKNDLNPLEKAAVSHYKLYRIHPFLDGNKRICRLIFNKALIDCHFPLINLSVQKEAYFDSLVEAVENGNPGIFVDFSLKQYYKQVREFLSG